MLRGSCPSTIHGDDLVVLGPREKYLAACVSQPTLVFVPRLCQFMRLILVPEVKSWCAYSQPSDVPPYPLVLGIILHQVNGT